MNLTDDPGVDSKAYFVIDPDNDSTREVVLWSSGTNHAAATVTRDVDNTHGGTKPTHDTGTKVRLAVVNPPVTVTASPPRASWIMTPLLPTEDIF